MDAARNEALWKKLFLHQWKKRNTIVNASEDMLAQGYIVSTFEQLIYFVLFATL